MWKEKYNKWANYKELDEELKTELNRLNDTEKEDAFYTDLTFGTGGIRGVLGVGTNRLNIYTIRKANYGFGKYLLGLEGRDKSVVIAYDNRNKSKDFAFESARVLAALGIKCYVFESLRPTPELSFAVRYLKATGGIVVTASHNPPEYNGYKIYDASGCQLVPRYANQVVELVDNVEDVFNIDVVDLETSISSGMIEIIGEKIDKLYMEQVKTIQLKEKMDKDIKIVFTPLHGTSAVIGYETLTACGYQVYKVEEQCVPDPNFSTVKSPNPENSSAFEYALKLGKEIDADVLIATDPDADRLGVAVKNNGEYILLTGNQTGAVLIKYILDMKKSTNDLPKHGMVYNTVVTSELGADIAKSYGMDVFSTLTGFKFIGEQAGIIEDTDQEFLFGYEESYGYVVKDFVRDKDSIQAMLIASEAAQYYHNQGKTLYDCLLDIYEEYGVYREALINIVLKGKTGSERISEIMSFFRENKPTKVIGNEVVSCEDYLLSKRYMNNLESDLTLPKSNVLKFKLINGTWFVLRPSGTEPKLKIYIGVKDETIDLADSQIELIKKEIMNIVESI